MRVRTIRRPTDIIAVTNILHSCGKDMAKKYDIHHWDNPWIKTLIIVLMCLKNNKGYVLEQAGSIVATYQIKVADGSLYFEKLAVKPEMSGRGLGSFCLNEIEEIAQKSGCKKVRMDVYSKSKHAIQFYKNHGFSQTGLNTTLKYQVVCLEKELN